MNMTVDSAEFAVTAEASDDLDLVHASKNGDVAAFEQLVKKTKRTAILEAGYRSGGRPWRERIHDGSQQSEGFMEYVTLGKLSKESADQSISTTTITDLDQATPLGRSHGRG